MRRLAAIEGTEHERREAAAATAQRSCSLTVFGLARLFRGETVSVLLLLVLVVAAVPGEAAERMLDPQMHHLRSGDEREWADFPERAEADRLVLRFDAQANRQPQTLQLRVDDVKHDWRLRVNGTDLGGLGRDENHVVMLWTLPPGALVDGMNTLEVTAAGQQTDDVRVGNVRLYDQPVEELLGQCRVEVEVVDESGSAIPCRLTVADGQGALMPIGAKSNDRLAVRNGMIYTVDGRASFGLLPGAYTLYAGRGFEYSVAKTELQLVPGETVSRRLQIRREVSTPGYVRCDTHVHTLSFSGHGDASIEERMLSLAGEGIELPVATDHNVHTDFEPYARRLGVRRYFTPVIGNEVTTRVGHFNVFPIRPGAAPPDHRLGDWPSIFASIRATPAVEAVILNHPRDVHSGFRPFGPERYHPTTGENLDGWQLEANAMELVNSGALQSDPLRLYHDWFGLLGRGMRITPVGSSDSHDVARKLVGQACTYIEAPDDQPAAIPVEQACANFLAGRVGVSMGLFVRLQVDGQHRPGDLAAVGGEVNVGIEVHAPSWISADRVLLFVNGILFREEPIESAGGGGLKWRGEWNVPRPRQDIYLVAVALGPGVTAPYWSIPRPYQPSSPVWNPYVIGSTGPVWLDADGDGKWTSPREQALELVRQAQGEPGEVVERLKTYDTCTAAHAASLLAQQGTSPADARWAAALENASVATRSGFAQFLAEWREEPGKRSEASAPR